MPVLAAVARLRAPIRLAELELASCVPGQPLPSGDRPTVLLVRWRGHPLGVAILGNNGRGIDGEPAWAAIARGCSRQLVHQLAVEGVLDPDAIGLTLGHRLARSQTTAAAASVTVAVCTRDRPALLRNCLDSLVTSTTRPADILVVDNAPATDDTRQLVSTAYPSVRYVREERPGLNHARNRAVEEAQTEVIAFTDDDCEVDAFWAGAIDACFTRNPDVTAVTGLVIPVALDTEAQRLFEVYGGFSRGVQRRWVLTEAGQRSIAWAHANTGKLGTGACMAFRRQTLQAMGGFDPALDVGTPTEGGGDLEVFFRTLKGRGLLVYEPAALVRHRHRTTRAELDQQLRGWGLGMSAHLARTAHRFPEERPAIVALRVWLLASWFMRRLASTVVREPFPRELILHELGGSFGGAARYRQSRVDNPSSPTPLPSIPIGARSAAHTVTLGAPLRAIERLDGVSSVDVSVIQGTRTLATFGIAPARGCIGMDRLADAVAAHCADALLGMPRAEAERQLRAMLETRP